MHNLLLKYCLENLVSSNQLKLYASTLNLKIHKSANKNKIVDELLYDQQLVNLISFHKFCLELWVKPNIQMHIDNLKSGLLAGHGWGGMMPSTLHHSFQDKVRKVCAGNIDLTDLIKIGEEVAKHEYFMVAIADLCEHLIVTEFNAIPSIISKGISDFVFNSFPYDLKNTTIPTGWTLDSATDDKAKFIESLIKGADIERIRKQAEGDESGWKSNRFYVVAKEENIWLEDPELALSKIKKEIRHLGHPFKIEVEGGKILAQIVFID